MVRCAYSWRMMIDLVKVVPPKNHDDGNQEIESFVTETVTPIWSPSFAVETSAVAPFTVIETVALDMPELLS